MNASTCAVSIRIGRRPVDGPALMVDGMLMPRARLRTFCLLLPVLLSMGAGSLRAATPSVTAVLTESETTVGRPVQMEIQVNGSGNPQPPQVISVDGLEIQSIGSQRQVQMNNFNVSYSVTFNYTILPLKAGNFTIPPQSIQVAGTTLQTPELKLAVSASGAQSGRGNTRSGGGRN